jgi:hypothetical protein
VAATRFPLDFLAFSAAKRKRRPLDELELSDPAELFGGELVCKQHIPTDVT